MSSTTILLIGAGFSAAAIFFTVWGTIAASNETSIQIVKSTSDLRGQNSDLSNQLSTLTHQNTEQGHTVAQLSAQNIELSKELATATGNLIGNITGGDSYCELVINPRDANLADFVLVQHGSFPVYNINARVVDVDNVAKMPKDNPTMQDVLNLGPNFTVDEIPPNTARPLGPVNLNFNKDQKSFNIFFGARNGYFNQYTRMYRIGGSWKSSTIIKTFDGKKVLYQKHDPALSAAQHAQ